MAVHFLMSAQARNLTLDAVLRLSEEQAARWFRKARWASTKGVPVCPRCGCIGAWEMKSGRYRCKAKECRFDFSVTSGTVFASRKLPFRKMVAAITLYVCSVKGKAALQMVRELGMDYKSAFTLLHKIREAIASERATMTLTGEIEIDAMYIGGSIRPKNRKEDRIDRRLAENQTGKRQCVLALRERQGRSVVTVVSGETADAVWNLVANCVVGPATIAADEAGAYDDLVGLFPTVRNNHGEAYVVERKASTNQAESLFSRVRRSAKGIHHRIAGNYLDHYVAELAYRDDLRGTSMKRLFWDVLHRALNHPVSRTVKGYWQGVHPMAPLTLRRR